MWRWPFIVVNRAHQESAPTAKHSVLQSKNKVKENPKINQKSKCRVSAAVHWMQTPHLHSIGRKRIPRFLGSEKRAPGGACNSASSTCELIVLHLLRLALVRQEQ